MLTLIVLVLVLLAAAVLVAWWLFDFDMPEVVIALAATGIGAGIIYWYGTALAWAIGILLLLAGGYSVWRLFARRGRQRKCFKVKGRDASRAPPGLERTCLFAAVARAGENQFGRSRYRETRCIRAAQQPERLTLRAIELHELSGLQANADSLRRKGCVGASLLPGDGAQRAITALRHEEGNHALSADLDENWLARADRTEIGEWIVGKRGRSGDAEHAECVRRGERLETRDLDH
jgi:hypothetical protein